jgi:uncharacterized protein DUF4291
MTDVEAQPERQVRAVFTSSTITVYQAYSREIAEPALAAGNFVSPFKLTRMTWIKPSFLWMMYRSGWASKPGQERILAVEITRDGFEWGLSRGVLSHYDPNVYDSEQQWNELKHNSTVRVQWDPERSIGLAPLNYRAIQIGLGGEAVVRYAREWIVGITDVTPLAVRIRQHVVSGDLAVGYAALPSETAYPLPEYIRERIGADPSGEPKLRI